MKNFLIKKYSAEGSGKIIFEFDKNDDLKKEKKYVSEEIISLELNKITNRLIVPESYVKNIIAYTGNLSFNFETKIDGLANEVDFYFRRNKFK